MNMSTITICESWLRRRMSMPENASKTKADVLLHLVGPKGERAKEVAANIGVPEAELRLWAADAILASAIYGDTGRRTDSAPSTGKATP